MSGMRALILLLVLTAGCVQGQPRDASTPAPTATPEEDPTVDLPVTGLVTEVDREGKAVVGFVVDADGSEVEILIDPERDYGFDLRHLEEHRDMGDPVAVEIEVRGNELYAVSIEDV